MPCLLCCILQWVRGGKDLAHTGILPIVVNYPLHLPVSIVQSSHGSDVFFTSEYINYNTSMSNKPLAAELYDIGVSG